MKKGFTLIELLAVIAILGALSLLVIFSVVGHIDRTKNQAFTQMVENVENLTMLYIANNRDSIPNINVANTETSITLNHLIVSGMMKEPVVDPITRADIPLTTDIYIHVLGKNDYYVFFDYRKDQRKTNFVKPVITLIGPAYVEVNVGMTYIDAGATVWDDVDVGIVPVMTSNVNADINGVYHVIYTATDSSGNHATPVIRTVAIVGQPVPSIAFNPNGNETWAQTRNSTVTATAGVGINPSSLKYLWTDNASYEPTEGNFSLTFTNGSSISSPAGVSGDYYLWILAKDTEDIMAIRRSNLFKLDNTPPAITITGGSPITINMGTTYTDQGATATDAHSGLNGSVQVVSTVNANVHGTYTVTYSITDNAGNLATAIRTVNVVDSVPPTLAFNPNGNTSWAQTRSSTVTASDASGINASSLKYQWTTSLTAPSEASFTLTFTNGNSISSTAGVSGGYYLWILAKDTIGNTTIGRSNIFNLDNTGPVITITGSNPITVNLGSVYNDAGATYSDAHSGVASSNAPVSTVNTSVAGTYTVTYGATDNVGNTSSAVRTVNVVDTVGPTLAFSPNGNATWAKTRSSTVTASDPSGINASSLRYQWTTSLTAPTEGSFSLSFTNGTSISSPAGVTGGYYLWILAKDTFNNTTIGRSNVFNLDNINPVITINGDNPIYVEQGTTYTDAGANHTDADSGIATIHAPVSTINMAVVGTYTVTYSSTDNAGNTASAVRTVHVTSAVIGGIYDFNYTGNFQTWVVPETTKCKIEVWGAAGGSRNNSHDARGGYAYGELFLIQGQTLYIYVGGQGGIYQTGGWPNGGDGGDTNASHTAWRGYKGGGSSDIRMGGQALTDRIIVAGGGGGAPGSDGTQSQRRSGGGGGGGGYYGGGGGSGGQQGGVAGQGGTQFAGGTGGGTTSGTTGGALGVGGMGGNTTQTGTQASTGVYPGGAGGGLDGFNGVSTGGNANAGSGGGGSSYIGGMPDDGTRGTGAGGSTGNGLVKITCPQNLLACGNNVIDSRDSKEYATVQIGSQCWMAQDLAYNCALSGYNNVGSGTNWGGTNNCGNQGVGYSGLLYQWSVAMNGSITAGAQGLCPTGWYIPSDNDIKTLEMYLGMTQVQADAVGQRGTNQGDQLKSNPPYWCNNANGCASSGFNALPTGMRDWDGLLINVGTHGAWWSSSRLDSSATWTRDMHTSSSLIGRSNPSQWNGYSVRCLRAQ
jgi:uncharacterized protein (TIGR02145 family)/prepilin-type N-terminal cleavage/methylation domain-containing protein